MSTYFLMAGSRYVVAGSATKCWSAMRDKALPKQRIRKGPYFMLEFAQDNLRIDVNTTAGTWQASAYPVRVVEYNKLPPEQLKRMAAWCKTGLERWAESQKANTTCPHCGGCIEEGCAPHCITNKEGA